MYCSFSVSYVVINCLDIKCFCMCVCLFYNKNPSHHRRTKSKIRNFNCKKLNFACGEYNIIEMNLVRFQKFPKGFHISVVLIFCSLTQQWTLRDLLSQPKKEEFTEMQIYLFLTQRAFNRKKGKEELWVDWKPYLIV